MRTLDFSFPFIQFYISINRGSCELKALTAEGVLKPVHMALLEKIAVGEYLQMALWGERAPAGVFAHGLARK